MENYRKLMSFWNKSKKEKSISIKICPKCEKPSLYKVKNLGWAITEIYHCKECDYEGAFYLEIDSNETGKKFVDLEKLKKLFPDDVEDETDLDIDKKALNRTLSSVE